VDLADGVANDGLLKRRALGLESRMFDMMGRHLNSRTYFSITNQQFIKKHIAFWILFQTYTSNV